MVFTNVHDKIVLFFLLCLIGGKKKKMNASELRKNMNSEISWNTVSYYKTLIQDILLLSGAERTYVILSSGRLQTNWMFRRKPRFGP